MTPRSLSPLFVACLLVAFLAAFLSLAPDAAAADQVASTTCVAGTCSTTAPAIVVHSPSSPRVFYGPRSGRAFMQRGPARRLAAGIFRRRPVRRAVGFLFCR